MKQIINYFAEVSMPIHQIFNTSNMSYNVRFFKNYTVENHFHKNFELIVVINGEIECTINKMTEILHPGDLALCLSNELHMYIPIGEAYYCCIVFSEDLIASFSNEVKGKRGTSIKFNMSDAMYAYINESLIYNKNPDTFLLKSSLYAICSAFKQQIVLEKNTDTEQALMLSISNYINEHYLDDITLKSMAEELKYQYNYLSRCFAKIFNMPFKDFVNTYRIEHAMLLLDENKKSIAQIAYDSGFQSVRNFNHVFRKKTGITPIEYRMNKKAKSPDWEMEISDPTHDIFNE